LPPWCAPLKARFLQQTSDELIRIEILCGNGPGRAGVQVIISADGPQGLGRLLHRGDGEQPPPGRQKVLKTRALQDHRTARGEKAARTIAEPTTPSAHVPPFRTAKLPERTRHVVPVTLRVRHHLWSFHLPPVLCQSGKVRVLTVDVQGDLQ